MLLFWCKFYIGYPHKQRLLIESAYINSDLPGGSGEQFKHQDPLL